MKNRVSIMCIIAMIVFLCEILVYGLMPSTAYFTYHIGNYSLSLISYVISLANFLAIFCIIACGVFEICDLKKLAKMFLLIQPIKLLLDCLTCLVYDLFKISLFSLCSGILLTFVMVYCADLCLKGKSEFKENSAKNLKAIIISMILCVAVDVVRALASGIISAVSYSMASTNANDSTRIMIIGIVLEFIMTLIILVIGTILLIKLFRKNYAFSGVESTSSKITGNVIIGVAILLIIASTIYFYKNSTNPITYYLSYLNV